MSLATYFVRLIIAITVFSTSAIAGTTQETQKTGKDINCRLQLG